MPTLYELKQSLGMIGQQLKNKNDELSQKATDPNIDMEDIKQQLKIKEKLINL